MSAQDEKSEDKKDIELEEREKIMNEENTAQDKIENVDTDKEVAKLKTDIKEGREVKPKKIPIGGIQMPGFFTRSRSKEKCKDSESEQGGTDAEGSELLENKEQSDAEDRPQKIKLPNPFGKKIKTGENDSDAEKSMDQSQQRKSLIDTIRIPLVSVFPRKTKDQNLASGGAAGLASMETLDDNDKSADKTEVEMKNIKLDSDDKTDVEKQSSDEETNWKTRFRAYRVVISALLIFVLILIVIVILIIPGREEFAVPIKDGKFVSTVTSCGMVEGMLQDGAIAFRGIPYARGPIKDLRWRPAHPINKIEYCWNDTLLTHNATDFCMQLYPNGTISGDENCLTLDVVTPYVRYDNPLPVVVMIGGESLTGGSPAKMRPSARYARSRDVVFVRPNFRLGALGFLSVDILSQATHPPTSGNYGLSDIITALQWVQLNIQQFGGDPKAVTLFGHRAGATLVTALTSIKNAKDLFARAWASSGSTIFPSSTLAESEQANTAYFNTLSCIDLACLKTVVAETLIEAVPDTWRKPSPDLPEATDLDPTKRHQWLVLDGNILKTHPIQVWKEEKLPVKLVLGSTAHAAASDFLKFRQTSWTPELVKAHIEESLLGKLNLTEEILKMYPATYQGLVSLVSDIRIICPLLEVSLKHSKVSFYVVNQTRGEDNLADIDSDVDAILGRYEPHSPEQRRYVASMQQLFYHYVWHGEILQTENVKNRVLVVGQDIIPEINYTHCDFWSKKEIVPKYGQLD